MFFHPAAVSDVIPLHIWAETARSSLILVQVFVDTVGIFIILPINVPKNMVYLDLIVDPGCLFALDHFLQIVQL